MIVSLCEYMEHSIKYDAGLFFLPVILQVLSFVFFIADYKVKVIHGSHIPPENPRNQEKHVFVHSQKTLL